MTKHDLAKPQIIEGFSVMKMKQEIQERIYLETEGMSSEELCEYFRQGSERFHEELRQQRTEDRVREVAS